MTTFNILVGFDTKSANFKASASHIMTKAIIVVDEDLYYESGSVMTAVTNTQSVIEFPFQMLKPNPVLTLQFTLLELTDNQLVQKHIIYFHATSQFQFVPDRQMIEFRSGKTVIMTECLVSNYEFDAMTCLPICELNYQDFKMPLSGCQFSTHFAIEVQTENMKFVKHLGSIQGDLGKIMIPFAKEFIIKLVYIMNLYGVQHVVTLANSKVMNSQALIKGALFEISDVDCNFDSQLFALIDVLCLIISQGVEEFKGHNDNKIKVYENIKPGFLQRYVLFKNPKLLDINYPRFNQLPLLDYSESKKIQKILQNEQEFVDDLVGLAANYEQFKLNLSIFFVIQTFPTQEKSQEVNYTDLCAVTKSVGFAAVKIKRQAVDFGFTLIHNKVINLFSCIQNFDIGTGNLAICKVQDNKQFTQIMHRANYNSVMKFLVNNAKSFVAASGKGINVHTISYELNQPYTIKNIMFTKSQIENNAKQSLPFLQQQISLNACLRLYVQDLIYCEKNKLTAPSMPEESILGDEQNGSQTARGSVLDDSRQSVIRGSLSSRVSFAQRQFNVRQFDPRKYIDYFGSKVRSTQFCNELLKTTKTLKQFIAEEKDRLQIEEDKRKAKEEIKRQELEKKRQEEEELARLEDERLRKLEEERLELERLQQEEAERLRLQEEQLAEEARLAEAERVRQLEQLKLMQLKHRMGKGNGRSPRKTHRPGMPVLSKATANVHREVKIDESLIQLKLANSHKIDEKNRQIAILVQQNQQKLQQIELEFEEQMMQMQSKLQLAKKNQNYAIKRIVNQQMMEIEDYEKEEEEFLLQQIRMREQLEKEHNDEMDRVDLQFINDCENDEKDFIDRKIKREKDITGQFNDKMAFKESIRAKYLEDQKLYEKVAKTASQGTQRGVVQDEVQGEKVEIQNQTAQLEKLVAPKQ
ncbi:hypothetical protein SS50377_25610 [Spironucleus salmonicida]|uniref:Uncharacterized protein n=1 Tax=Spironucleus salmonicida TaxID=348837 RepID=V6M7N8_9EUKA|nr:hypothetical protein SS50377_25610 [Spironucleus salmonicida]|eukprot:EST49489.1 Hypothetical protein SS50377_10238 [Spironucleus salmonicida]